MIFHKCDICGKLMQNKTVMQDTDPMDYRYGDFVMEANIGMQGHYHPIELEDVCHECARKIQNIDVDDFVRFFIDEFMG